MNTGVSECMSYRMAPLEGRCSTPKDRTWWSNGGTTSYTECLGGNKMPTRCNRGFLQILLLAQHVSGTTMSIIRSSRVLHSGSCLWYFVLWFSSCWSGVELRVMCPVCRMLVKLLVWCGAEGYVSGLQDAAASCKPDT